MTMQLVETITLTGNAASFTFSNIPQDADDLMLVISARVSIDGYQTGIRFNGDSSSSYYDKVLYSDGGVTSQNRNTQPQIRFGPPSSDSNTTNTFGNARVYIPDYKGSKQKAISVDSVSENMSTPYYAFITAGLWTGTAAITSILLNTEGAAVFRAKSSVSLYKITKA